MVCLYNEAVDILRTGKIKTSKYYKEGEEIRLILEDVNSPVTQKYQQKLFMSVLNKAHIDFDDIPRSAGNIRNYSGYGTMIDTLNTILKLAEEDKVFEVMNYVKIVLDAVNYIADLSSTYEKGFTTKTEYVALEYDTYVYFCVEATTALIYSFVEIVKRPEKTTYDMKIKNTKLRADEFYFEQLKKFNNVQAKLGIEYRKMIENMCNNKNNFIGTATAVGLTTVIVAALSIVPITREAIYQIYNFRGKLSKNLEMQARFLELNKACIDNNDLMTLDKKEKVKTKQEELAKTLMKLADEIRVKSSKSIMDSKRELTKENKMLSINNIKDEVSNSPFEIL